MAEKLGIVFTGGKGPSPEILKRILNGCEALIVAADSGLLPAEAAGLKPHWVTGDMDSLGDESRLRTYPAERVIRHAADKDFTDTELALALLRQNGCDRAWIVGGGGGRIDHLFGIRELFERDNFLRRWITDAEDIYSVEDGGVTWNLTPGALVSVFPLGGGPWQAESSGLKWPLDNVRWQRGMFGLSNVATAEKIAVNAKQGRFMVTLGVAISKTGVNHGFS
jgi:thiamine pyrophosphokinase